MGMSENGYTPSYGNFSRDEDDNPLFTNLLNKPTLIELH